MRRKPWGGVLWCKKTAKKKKSTDRRTEEVLAPKKIAQKTIVRCGVCVFHYKDRNSIERRFSCSVLSPSREAKKKKHNKKARESEQKTKTQNTSCLKTGNEENEI